MCYICEIRDLATRDPNIDRTLDALRTPMPEPVRTTPPEMLEENQTGFGPFLDIPANTATWATLFVGGSLNAEISTTADVDWFRADLVAGETYQISLSSLDFFGIGLGDPALWVLDFTGNTFFPLAFDDDSGAGRNAVIEFEAGYTGTHYLVASGLASTGPTVGQYQIALNRIDRDADVVGQTNRTAAQIAVDQQVLGSIDFAGDEDWYKVTLEEGRTYAFQLDANAFSFTPLGNPLLEIADRRGNVLAFNDDNGISFNSLATLQVDATGTYYVRAKSSFGTTGDFALQVYDITPPEPPSPVEGLDWGVQFDKGTITYYFARAGETFGSSNGIGVETTESDWTAYEKRQAASALGEYSRVANVGFNEVTSAANADFILQKSFLDSSLSGKMAPQDPALGNDQGLGWFNTNPRFWSDEAGGKLEKGAYGYSNFVHEFGHAMGMAHPHDNGGTSSIFDGVTSSADAGTRALNQEVYTVMSYNKGWLFGPEGGSGTNDYGIARTLMAFDIALIQRKYGANTDHATGNDTYRLFTENGRGTGYEAIWDAGGRDRIVNPGRDDSTIDLRPATLKLEDGGGGFLSWVDGIFGGFTIANGVTIEDAEGNRGADTIIGNAAANSLSGKGGNDVISGNKGNDDIAGGGGSDDLSGGAGRDDIGGGKGADTIAGNKGNDTLNGEKGRDTVNGGSGHDTVNGGFGNDELTGGKGDDVFVFGKKSGSDVVLDFGRGADVLDLSFWNYGGFRAVRRDATDTGDGVRIDFDDTHNVTLAEVAKADLVADHFLL